MQTQTAIKTAHQQVNTHAHMRTQLSRKYQQKLQRLQASVNSNVKAFFVFFWKNKNKKQTRNQKRNKSNHKIQPNSPASSQPQKRR